MFGLSQETIDDISSVFRLYQNIDKVFIFGSRAKGNYKEGSDIDLAILSTEPLSIDVLMDISNKIDDLELLYKVDIISYNDTKETPIREHIERVKQVFYDKNTSNSK